MPPELPLHLTLTGRPLLLYPPVAPELHQRLQNAYAPRASRLLNRLERRKSKKKSKSTATHYDAAQSRRMALRASPDPVRHEPYLEHIKISGPLLNKAEMWGETVCVDGYDRIESAISRAAHDVDCAGILLEIDSPGGMVSGCFELSDKIRDWAKEKPILVHTDSLLCSAAYALACGATEIMGQMTALIGSIGVVYGRLDVTGWNEKNGVKIDFLKSGEQKTWGNPETKMDDAELAAHQTEILLLADMFFDRVAAGRGLTPDAVRDLQAGTFLTGTAQDHGLADNLGDISDAMARLSELALAHDEDSEMNHAADSAAHASGPANTPTNPVEPSTTIPAATASKDGPAESTKQEKPMSKLTRVALVGQLSAVAMMMASNAMEDDEIEAIEEEDLEAAIASETEDEVEAMDDDDVTAMDDEDKSAIEESEDDDVEMMNEDDDDAEAKTFAATASRIARKATASVKKTVAAKPTGDPVKDAVTADRKRAADIKALPEAKGRESLADHFASTDMSVDDAKAALAAAPKAAKGGRLANVKSPDIGTGAGKPSKKSSAGDDLIAAATALAAKK